MVRNGGQSRTKEQNDAINNWKADPQAQPFGYPSPKDAVENGWGNKSISLKFCRNVIIRGLKITAPEGPNHDGIVIDSSSDVLVEDCDLHTSDDAVALKSGASANARYQNGVAVFTATKGGLMAEAAVGGQKFSFEPFK